LSYSIKSQLQEEKEARLNKTPEKEARGNMKLMYYLNNGSSSYPQCEFFVQRMTKIALSFFFSYPLR